MDVDKSKLSKLTEKEKLDCVKNGKCFRCRQKGHNSRDCPNFPASTSAPSRTYSKPTKARRATVKDESEADDEESDAPKKVRKAKGKKKAASSTRSSSPSTELPSYDEDQKARILRRLIRETPMSRLEEIISQNGDDEDFP